MKIILIWDREPLLKFREEKPTKVIVKRPRFKRPKRYWAPYFKPKRK